MTTENDKDIFDFLETQGLELPPFGDDFFDSLIPESVGHGWKTIGGPDITPTQDYLQESFDLVLADPISPQWALNFAGHGINSHSVNLRMVIGSVFVAAQWGWGGVYMNKEEQRDSWNDGMEALEEFFDSLDLSTDIHQVPAPRQIEVAICYSEFRGSRAFYRRDGEGLIEIPLKAPNTLAALLNVVLKHEQPSWGFR